MFFLHSDIISYVLFMCSSVAKLRIVIVWIAVWNQKDKPLSIYCVALTNEYSHHMPRNRQLLTVKHIQQNRDNSPTNYNYDLKENYANKLRPSPAIKKRNKIHV